MYSSWPVHPASFLARTFVPLEKPYITSSFSNNAKSSVCHNSRLRSDGCFCMEFCPTCGSFLAPVKSKVGDDTVIVFACSKCEYTKPALAKKAQLRVKRVVQPKSEQSVTVISQEDQKMQTMPTIRVACPKCGNNLVFVWQVQTRGGDEASTQFMRCTKCSHTFREYT